MRGVLYTLLARIRGFLRPDAIDADFEEEMAAHLAAAEDDGVRRGLPREEARRMARVQLGGLTQLREASRAAQGLPWLDTLRLDVTLGVRLLVKHPGLTLVSTLALATGIAIVAGFHAGTEFIVRPVLPDAPDDRLVAIWNHDVASSDRGQQTIGDMLAWRQSLTSVEQVGAFVLQHRAVAAADGGSRLVHAAQISASAFALLPVTPLLGRPLVENDERPGGAAVALVGFELWQSALHGDPAIVGKTIRIGGAEHTVVGVMPRGFAFPRREQIWTPLRVPGAGSSPGDGPAIDMSFGRLAPGVGLKEAETELQVLGLRLAADNRRTHSNLRPRIAPYAASFLEADEPGLAMALQAARALIALVLLVVAVNVGTLVYARNASRVGEVAVRTALGASRRRIAVQMFLEALVLASLAGVVGVAIMSWPLHLLGEIFATAVARGDDVPYWFVVSLGPNTMRVVAGLVLVSAVLTGVLPALKLTDRRMRSQLQRVQEGVAGLRFGTAASLVVVSQVAISVALLTVAGAQLRTFVDDRASLDDTNAIRSGYLTAQLRWDSPRLTSRADVEGLESARRAETRRALDRQVSQEPGVRGVTFDAFLGVRRFESAAFGTAEPAWTYVVSIEPDYFAVHNASILAGRAFDEADVPDLRRRVAIVNEAFVRTVLPAGDAIGRRVRPVDTQNGRVVGEPLEIVGVVQDSRDFEISQSGPAWVARPTLYVPLTTAASPLRMTVHVPDEPGRFAPRLTALGARIDPTLVVHQPMPLDRMDSIDRMFLRLYWFSAAVLVFAVVLLSVAGVYSMMSFLVAQRRREIGIRMALGARPAHVVRDVFSRALRQVGAGSALGLSVGFAAADGPFALSEGVFHHGPAVAIAMAALIAATAVVACGLPLRRALKIQPTEALKAEG